MRILLLGVLLLSACGGTSSAVRSADDLDRAWTFEVVRESPNPIGGASPSELAIRRSVDDTFAWRDEAGHWSELADPAEMPAQVAAIDWATLSQRSEGEVVGGALVTYRLVRNGSTMEVRRRASPEAPLAAAERTLSRLIAAERARPAAPPPSQPSRPPGSVTGPAQTLPAAGPEGITGRVTILTGDHMPPDDQPGGAPAANAPVHVLRGSHAPVDHLDRSAAHYVGSTTTAADGTYRIALPPGTYTVLIEHDGRPYRNSFSGDGTWSVSTVSAGAWLTLDIQDSALATF